MLDTYPIKHSNREELVLYLCDIHNKVNERLNKPVFNCEKAFDFWGGNCGCDKHEDINSNSTNTNLTNINYKK
jgi:FAD-linked sulfhydryl oxidase